MATTTERDDTAGERITLPVGGMTCAACQASVQRALNAAPGVHRAAVNLMTNEASVVYDPRIASPESPRVGSYATILPFHLGFKMSQ